MRDDDVARTAAIPVAGAMADLSGSVVAGRYHLAGVLGQGAMANVYRALDGRLDREVAVKLFHPGQGAAVRTRFGAEAAALARLSHPGLVGIYDAGVEGGRPYLVMQLVDGETLRERLLDGRMDTDDVVLLGARLATALAHVHANGIVHRDIKPSNIVLDANGSPHLADFGIALLLDSVRMTSSGEIMGTAAYLSPEQILGVGVGAPADVYSLGLVLLECLTGELEYPGASKVESALARLHRPPRMPAGIPAVLAELLIAMTARDPRDRPPAGDCAAWFWAVREHSGMSSRAARIAAAHWLSRKGGQFVRSRVRQPLFAGWRRFAVAGSGIALAILASTWLFTSMLPRVMPPAPLLGSQQPPTANRGFAGPSLTVPATAPTLHMAVAVDPAGRVPSSTMSHRTGATSLGTSSQLSITSNTSGSVSATSSGTSRLVLQDSGAPPSIEDGPDDGGSSGGGSPGGSPTPTTTPTGSDGGGDNGPNSPPPTTSTTSSSPSTSEQNVAKHRDIHSGNGFHGHGGDN